VTCMPAKILVVEDEAALVIALRDRLRKEGYVVSVAKNGVTGFESATNEKFDLIILDLMLPGKDGLAVCQKLRQTGFDTPILMLTARRQTMDKVAGLRTGADDYVTKPFQMAELLARIESLLRRSTQAKTVTENHYRFGSVHIDTRRVEVLRDGAPVALSAREFQLLRYFVEHRGATLSREELLREVWGYGVAPSTRTVDVHVAWLRQKLENDPKNPKWILTVVGLGYKFADSA
jgi:two-component system, OmpR family, alkaline phosphatase synthesis response regulator PhoP